MSAAYDNGQGNLLSNIPSGGTGTMTSFTVTSSNPTIFLFTYLGAGTDADASATANGTSMTKLSSVSGAAKGNSFYITGVSGSVSIVVKNNAGSARDCRAIAVSYSGTNQTPIYSGGGQTAAFSSSNATSINITGSVTTITNNSWVVTGGADDNRSLSAGTNVLLRVGPTGTVLSVGDSNSPEPVGSFSQTWTTGGNSDPVMIMQVEINPSGSASNALPHRPLLGVGI